MRLQWSSTSILSLSLTLPSYLTQQRLVYKSFIWTLVPGSTSEDVGLMGPERARTQKRVFQWVGYHDKLHPSGEPPRNWVEHVSELMHPELRKQGRGYLDTSSCHSFVDGRPWGQHSFSIFQASLTWHTAHFWVARENLGNTVEVKKYVCLMPKEAVVHEDC